jgi:hypothetical protein
LSEGSFHGTELQRSGRSFCINVVPTPFAWFETFRLLEGCSLWATQIVFLKSSICRWMAIVGVASHGGVGLTASAFSSSRLLRRDVGRHASPGTSASAYTVAFFSVGQQPAKKSCGLGKTGGAPRQQHATGGIVSVTGLARGETGGPGGD